MTTCVLISSLRHHDVIHVANHKYCYFRGKKMNKEIMNLKWIYHSFKLDISD